MSDNGNPGDGSDFVIAGMTFREVGPEPAHWTSGRVAAVAPVDVTIGAGITVTVDVARPWAILEFSIAEFGDPALLVEACEPGADSFVDQVVGGQTPSGAAPTLRADWARKALTTGISRWLPRPVHEGALLLDEAAAHHAVGHPVAAARLLALAAPVLEALASDCESGYLSAATAVVLSDVARAAKASVSELDWGAAVGEYADRIAAATGVSEFDLEAGLLLLSEGERVVSGSSTAGAPTGQGLPAEVKMVGIDPTVTTARILKWGDAGTKELRVEEHPEADGTRAVFEVALSDFVDDRCYEVSRVTAFVGDAATGTVLRTARTHLDGRTLRANLRFTPPASGRVVYGVFDGDKGVSALRTRDVDVDVIAIDRLLLDAWSTHRAALVAQMRLGGLDGGALADAERGVATLVGHARDLVTQARYDIAALSGVDAEATDRRAVAVDDYLSELAEQQSVPHAGCEPLLAELLPLTPEPDDGR